MKTHNEPTASPTRLKAVPAASAVVPYVVKAREDLPRQT